MKPSRDVASRYLMKISNTKELGSNILRQKALAIAEAGLIALDSAKIVRGSLRLEGDNILAGGKVFELKPDSKVVVIGVGKCAIDAVQEVEKILGERITRGVVSDMSGNKTCSFKKIECVAGSHPLPTEANVAAAKKVVGALSNLSPNDFVLFIISGGGSTFLCLPKEGGSAAGEAAIVTELFRAGAPIQDINTIRKHLSLARGGYLARYAYPARVASLIFSDVPGNDIGFIASGPTVKDMTTIADAELILAKYRILQKCNIENCGLIETPKDDKYFADAHNVIVASNIHALKAMEDESKKQGFVPSIRNAEICGEARVAGAGIAQDIAHAPAGSAYLYGGETTVTVRGGGRGGRNQEVALSALRNISPDSLILSLASDGKDNGPYAGAIADEETLQRARAGHFEPKKYLTENNASEFFEKTGSLLKTGSTGVNVSDLIIAVKDISKLEEKNMDNQSAHPAEFSKNNARNDARNDVSKPNDAVKHNGAEKNANSGAEKLNDVKKLAGPKSILWMEEVRIVDVPEVGGKNASLGEMIANLTPKGVKIPSGFIVTATAYRSFLKTTKLDELIRRTLDGLKTDNLKDLDKRARIVREAIVKETLPQDLQNDITNAYAEMEKRYGKNIDTAVRSSATAEDLPGASFAGEHDTYLGIRGAEQVINAVKSAMASLFTARAISYRVDKGFDHFKVALSVGVERMVRSDKGCSGVMFTLDTESGFRDVIIINGSWGLGEMVVQGKVTPDEFIVAKKTLNFAPNPIIFKKIGSKSVKMIYGAGRTPANKQTKVVNTTEKERAGFSITDAEVKKLAEWGMKIEEHYSVLNKKWMPMDIEWAKDGITGELFVVQARPETIHAERDFSKIREYIRKEDGKLLVKGASVGSKIATGKARVILDVKGIGQFKKGEVLITDMTDPDWEPIMKIAAAIVTDKGGRTSHAAIVSRELGIPAVVGSESATRKIKTGQVITVDASGSDGLIFDGALRFETVEHNVAEIPKLKTRVMMNLATPDTAFEKSFLPNMGVGLAREEFIIASVIGIHPLAMINYKKLPVAVRKKIDARTKGWNDKIGFYVDNLAYGIAKIAAAFNPKPVIVRFSDFKTNEYRSLIGGALYEPTEENPMIGWRGASRYYDPKFKDAFRLECDAVKKVRDEMGFGNVILIVPFCRTPEEGEKTLQIMAESGLLTDYIAKKQGKSAVGGKPTGGDRSVGGGKSASGNVTVYVMCEIPSNVILADEFLDIFDGMSIGSNDLTQLVLGLDRDSGIVSHVANEKNPAVRKMIGDIIKTCKAKGKYIGICGQAPSDHPDFAEFLVKEGIDSISLNPDTVVKTTLAIAEAERKQNK